MASPEDYEHVPEEYEDWSVPDLEDQLADTDDPDVVEQWYVYEEQRDDPRSTALDAIAERLVEVDDDVETEEEAEAEAETSTTAEQDSKDVQDEQDVQDVQDVQDEQDSKDGKDSKNEEDGQESEDEPEPMERVRVRSLEGYSTNNFNFPSGHVKNVPATADVLKGIRRRKLQVVSRR